MDPNAALARIRKLIADINQAVDSGEGYNFAADATELVELVEGLDEWISKGGFLPKAWGIDALR